MVVFNIFLTNNHVEILFSLILTFSPPPLVIYIYNLYIYIYIKKERGGGEREVIYQISPLWQLNVWQKKELHCTVGVQRINTLN